MPKLSRVVSIDSDRRRLYGSANLHAPGGLDPLLGLFPLVGNGTRYRYSTGEVDGPALQGDLIFDGDTVISQVDFDIRSIRPGELIAASTPEGLLLRHAYFGLDRRVRLVAAHPDYPDIVFPADAIIVRGVGAYVVRKI